MIFVTDNKLHGRAYSWTGILWYCISGNDSIANSEPSVTLIFFLSRVGGKFLTNIKLTIFGGRRVLACGFYDFGLQAKCLETGETVAIKKVLQDKRYKNRELQTMRLLDHPNVVSLKHCFFSTTEKDELYLNLVLEYVPETVYRVIKHYTKANQRMPLIYVKLYAYQVIYSFSED